MPLILAIEPDRRQAAQLKRLVHGSIRADLVLADTTELALGAIGNRIPDLVLVPALLSPQDDAALATALRVIAAAAHVQTLTIPVFAASVAPARSAAGVLAKWRRGRAQAATPEGCDPNVFAEQIAAYLAEAAAARQALSAASADEQDESRRPMLHDTAAQAGASRSSSPPHAAAPLDADQWETDQWMDADDPETSSISEANEPVAFEHERAPAAFENEPMLAAFESEAARRIEPEPLVDADVVEWQPIIFSRIAGQEAVSPDADAFAPAAAARNTTDTGDVELRDFLADFEEQPDEPRVEPAVAPQPLDFARAAKEIAARELAAKELAAKELAAKEPTAKELAAKEPARKKGTDSWAAMSLAPHRWPNMEGVPVERHRVATPSEATATDPDAGAAEALEATVPEREVRVASRPESSRPEWLEMLDALRRDMDRLRIERTEGTAPTEPAPTAAPAAAANVATPGARKKPRQKDKDKDLDKTPVQDEWGFFDPKQCGFTALLSKLDEISDSNDETTKR